jgi:large subunit ribosomal protein L22
MAFGVKTNERPGTRAQVRYVRMSAYKAREVLDLIRGKDTAEADAVLQFVERDAAIVIRKCLASAVANAVHNDEQPEDELYVAACYADEGPTLKRWRPRARGRATRIRKRTCHITIVVGRLSDEQLERRRAKEAASPAAARARRAGRAAAEARRARVAKSRRTQEEAHDHDHDDELEADDVVEDVEELDDDAALDADAEVEVDDDADLDEDDEVDADDVDDELEAADLDEGDEVDADDVDEEVEVDDDVEASDEAEKKDEE